MSKPLNAALSAGIEANKKLNLSTLGHFVPLFIFSAFLIVYVGLIIA